MRAAKVSLDSPIARARDMFDRALRDLIEACSLGGCWQMHQAAPSAAGWRLLASYEVAAAHRVRRDAFGGLLDCAIQTLAEAIEQESDGARRVVMASWLSRLAE